MEPAYAHLHRFRFFLGPPTLCPTAARSRLAAAKSHRPDIHWHRRIGAVTLCVEVSLVAAMRSVQPQIRRSQANMDSVFPNFTNTFHGWHWFAQPHLYYARHYRSDLYHCDLFRDPGHRHRCVSSRIATGR